MTNLLHRNVKFVTVHNKCSKIPPSTSVHFATRVLRSRVVRLSWSSRVFMQAAASKMRASNSSVHRPLFCKLRSSSNRTNKNPTDSNDRSKQFYLSNHSQINTFFLHSEGPRSRCYGRTTALRHFVQPCDEDDHIFFSFLQVMEHQWNEIDRGKPTTRRKTCPSATLSTTNPTWTDPLSNPGLRSGRTDTRS
jgi:hypothetical protein